MPRITDILDFNGKVLRTEDLDVAHQSGLLHRSVHVLVVNDGGDIFVRRRPQSKPIYPDLWTSSVGTHVLTGQNDDDVAAAALKDFLGIDAPLTNIGQRHVQDAFENELITIYTCRANDVPTLNPNESSGGAFMPAARIQTLAKDGKTTPHLPAAVETYEGTLQ